MTALYNSGEKITLEYICWTLRRMATVEDHIKFHYCHLSKAMDTGHLKKTFVAIDVNEWVKSCEKCVNTCACYLAMRWCLIENVFPALLPVFLE